MDKERPLGYRFDDRVLEEVLKQKDHKVGLNMLYQDLKREGVCQTFYGMDDFKERLQYFGFTITPDGMVTV